MIERHALRALSPCAALILSSCILRYDDDTERARSRGGSDISPLGPRYLDPAPPRTDDRDVSPVTSESQDPRGSGLPQGLHRQLLVIDPEIVAGPRADEAIAGAPFSFRTQMEWLAGSPDAALAFTRAWLRAWETTAAVGPERTPVTPRSWLGPVLIDAWSVASARPQTRLASTSADDTPAYASPPEAPASEDSGVYPESEPAPLEPSDPYAGAGEGDDPGGYDPRASGSPPEAAPNAGYGPASEPSLSWASAPFRLIAIVNRVDLASDACDGYGGELRYVYAARDPLSGEPLDLTLIIEVPYPTTRSASAWARAWNELAALPAGEPFVAGLAELTREIRADGDPLRARLRSNEVALADPDAPGWEMREFRPQIQDGAMQLVQLPLELTPRPDADPAELSAYVLEHAEEIEQTGAALPPALQAGAASIDTPDFSWSVLGVSERLRRAFSLQTCNGCHGGDTAALPFQHIGPSSSFDSPARLSRFLYAPDASSDELRRRAGVLDALAEAVCAPSAGGDAYPGG